MHTPRTRVHHTHGTRDSAVITRQDVLMSCDRMPRSSRPSVRATLLFELSRAASVQAVYSLAQDVYKDTYISIYTYTYTCTHTYIYTYSYSCMHVYIFFIRISTSLSFL